MPTDSFTYAWTVPTSGADVALDDKFDLIIKALDVGWFPKDALDAKAEVLMSVTVTSGKEARSWSALVKGVKADSALFDAKRMAYFVADNLPAARTGVRIDLEMREVDNFELLKKVLSALADGSEFIKVIPVAGAVLGSIADVGGALVGHIPDEVGKVFFSATHNFVVKGGLAPYADVPLLKKGDVVCASTGPAGKGRKGSRLGLTVL